MTNTKGIVCLVITAFIAGCASTPAGDKTQQEKPGVNKLVIHADKGKETINRNIYGHFSEHLGRCIYGGIWVGEDSAIPNTRGIRNDVVEALKRMKIPVLRWPGGCFADEYHWKDGVGPRNQRPTMVNTHWGGVTENNHFGTHEFLDLCEQLGCEPYICGNVGSGTVQEMQQWVEYITFDGKSPMADWRRENGRDKPWKVKYWGVGNENWGCGGRMEPEYYANLYRRYSTYLRNFGDNRLFKIACGARKSDYDWTEVLMRDAGRNMNGLAPHYYCGSGSDWTRDGVTTLSLWHSGYMGDVGSFTEDPAGTYTMTATGADIWNTSDEFHFAFKELTSAGSIIVKVESVDQTDPSAKAGVMIRDTLDADSIHAMVVVTPAQGVSFQRRRTAGASSFSTDITGIMAPQWVKIERNVGGIVTASYSADGSSWIQVGTEGVNMNIPMYIGLAVTAHNTSEVCEAKFSNVNITGTVSGQWTNQDIGIISNTAEPMYVVLNGSAVVPHDNPNAALITEWTEWNIDLQERGRPGRESCQCRDDWYWFWRQGQSAAWRFGYSVH